MTALVFATIAVAGGLGAVARMVLDGLIKARLRGSTPWGTIAINVSGSLVLGYLTGLAAGQLLPTAWFLVIGTGFRGRIGAVAGRARLTPEAGSATRRTRSLPKPSHFDKTRVA